MKKRIAFLLLGACALALLCAATVTGSGVLDLSNIVRGVCIGVAALCGIPALVLLWKEKGRKG